MFMSNIYKIVYTFLETPVSFTSVNGKILGFQFE